MPDHIPNEAHGGHTIDEAFNALASAHDKSLGDIKTLTTQLNQANARVLQLENQLASGKF